MSGFEANWLVVVVTRKTETHEAKMKGWIEQMGTKLKAYGDHPNNHHYYIQYYIF